MENQVALIIYDNNGTVVTMLYGVTTVPSGVQGIVTEVPARLKSAYVDIQNNRVIFEVYPDTEEEVTTLQNAMADHEARLLALEG